MDCKSFFIVRKAFRNNVCMHDSWCSSTKGFIVFHSACRAWRLWKVLKRSYGHRIGSSRGSLSTITPQKFFFISTIAFWDACYQSNPFYYSKPITGLLTNIERGSHTNFLCQPSKNSMKKFLQNGQAIEVIFKKLLGKISQT